MERKYIATGRRKNAVARVRLVEGKGEILVNEKKGLDYFKRETLILLINQPFMVTNTLGKYDVMVNVAGGGLSGQAGAVQLGISRILVKLDESVRKALRLKGLLTRDPRMVERKKAGEAGARKKFQFSKR